MIQITDDGIIKGGECDTQHRLRYEREQAADLCVNEALRDGCLERRGDKVRITKEYIPTLKVVDALGLDNNAEVTYWRVCQNVINNRVGRTVGWKFFLAQVAECSPHGTGFDNSIFQGGLYEKRKARGDFS